jgi:Amt family ammonium transporter
VLTYFAIGFAWQGYLGSPSQVWMIHGKPWRWIGSEHFLMRGVDFDNPPYSLAVMFGMFAIALAAVIPLGAAAERWRLSASCASTALLAGLTYPLFAHWIWGGGWLAQLGINYQMGRGFIDSGGASSIHSVGGLTALSIAWILGPRHGKYQSNGTPVAMPAHNASLVLSGCILAWAGFLGLDCAGSVLFLGMEASRALVVVNATLAAAAAVLSGVYMTRVRFGKADASLCANAWVAGLVASAGGCAVVRPAGAVVTGVIAGVLVVFSVELLELHFRVDDPGGAISVHGVGGLWGVLAAGLFAQSSRISSSQEQWLAQLVGIATLLGFVLPAAYGLNWLLNKVIPQRAGLQAERQGLDLDELGTGGYPEFMIHNDEY